MTSPAKPFTLPGLSEPGPPGRSVAGAQMKLQQGAADPQASGDATATRAQQPGDPGGEGEAR